MNDFAVVLVTLEGKRLTEMDKITSWKKQFHVSFPFFATGFIALINVDVTFEGNYSLHVEKKSTVT